MLTAAVQTGKAQVELKPMMAAFTVGVPVSGPVLSTCAQEAFPAFKWQHKQGTFIFKLLGRILVDESLPKGMLSLHLKTAFGDKGTACILEEYMTVICWRSLR